MLNWANLVPAGAWRVAAAELAGRQRKVAWKGDGSTAQLPASLALYPQRWLFFTESNIRLQMNA
jgi:hypothetical protein